jgi:hypothetical protein
MFDRYFPKYVGREGSITGCYEFSYGSIAPVWPAGGGFRSTPLNGHSRDSRACLQGVNDGHRGDTAIAYSITSSVRTRIVGGIVSPSARAVLRLTISSNLVGS